MLYSSYYSVATIAEMILSFTAIFTLYEQIQEILSIFRVPHSILVRAPLTALTHPSTLILRLCYCNEKKLFCSLITVEDEDSNG